MNDIMVSICCMTYNQADYIKDAIESFLMQKTNFKFEIIIHDDASKDNTQKIIKEYEKKYPDIIKPIYQVENQYSKGEKIELLMFEKAQGKYIALCEGDDYWVYKEKLQKQVEYMEEHPECSLCFHDAKIFDEKTKKFFKYKYQNKRCKKKNGIYTAGELELYGFIPTASYLFKKEHVSEMPEFFYRSIVGDKPLRLILASYGYAFEINKIMSVYRKGTGISVTDRFNLNNEMKKKAIKHYEDLIKIIDGFNEFSSWKFKDEMEISKKKLKISILENEEKYSEILKNPEFRKILTKKIKLKYFIKLHFPKLFLKIKKLKNVLLKNYIVR